MSVFTPVDGSGISPAGALSVLVALSMLGTVSVLGAEGTLSEIGKDATLAGLVTLGVWTSGGNSAGGVETDAGRAGYAGGPDSWPVPGSFGTRAASPAIAVSGAVLPRLKLSGPKIVSSPSSARARIFGSRFGLRPIDQACSTSVTVCGPKRGSLRIWRMSSLLSIVGAMAVMRSASGSTGSAGAAGAGGMAD